MKHKYPIYFKNFSEKKYIIKSINQYGLSVIKSLIDKKTILKIRTKATKALNQPSLLETASCIYPKYSKKNFNNLEKPSWLPKKFMKDYDSNVLKQPTAQFTEKLSKKTLSRGYKYYGNFTNSIEFKDFLINFPEIIKIVFNENAIEVAENFLKSKVYLGYVALRCHFSNNLPGNDFNLFHTDGRNKVTQDKNKLLKFLIPFHLKNNKQTEFGQILFKRNKIRSKDFYRLQYSKINKWPLKIKNFLIRPKIFSGDAHFFDPDNFFHSAAKPKKLRIMLYIVYIKNGNYMINKTKKIRIKKSLVNKLSNKQRSFGRYLNLV